MHLRLVRSTKKASLLLCREGYGSRSVCVSVTKLAATYLACRSKDRLPVAISTNETCQKIHNALFKGYGDICCSSRS